MVPTTLSEPISTGKRGRMARVGDTCFSSHTKYIMLYKYVVFSSHEPIIIRYTNAEKFRYHDYLAISVFN